MPVPDMVRTWGGGNVTGGPPLGVIVPNRCGFVGGCSAERDHVTWKRLVRVVDNVQRLPPEIAARICLISTALQF
eukprot:2807216-Rhodomonas_salina.1